MNIKAANIRKMTIQTIAVIVSFLIISTVIDFWRGKSLPVGNIPEGIYFDTLNQSINLSDISSEQLTIVYFWATWCGPCKMTSPSIKQLAKSYPVISIAMASGNNKNMPTYFQKFEAKNNVHIPIINDDNQAISKQWGVKVTPTIIFIKNKKILGYTTGISGYPSLWLRAWWLDK
ncbi:MAG: protein disulfide oxidoreductase [Saccharospirillaceae bacterium]|nr:protein disulfide oxidoreductase [Pseudomonadales bacterium]NRB80565.1 protein disulfide oxidoreductase [Saccharospirillaceae bacterium]